MKAVKYNHSAGSATGCVRWTENIGETCEVTRVDRPGRFQAILVSSSLLLLATSLNAEAISSWPEERTPILSSAETTVRAVYLNNWLADNIGSIPQNQIQPIKENIYLIIDSIIKENKLESKNDFSKSDTFFLKSMFNWASYLNVPG